MQKLDERRVLRLLEGVFLRIIGKIVFFRMIMSFMMNVVFTVFLGLILVSTHMRVYV